MQKKSIECDKKMNLSFLENLDQTKLLVDSLKAMFIGLVLFSLALIIFLPAGEIAETFLDDYVLVLLLSLVFGGLFSSYRQKKA